MLLRKQKKKSLLSKQDIVTYLREGDNSKAVEAVIQKQPHATDDIFKQSVKALRSGTAEEKKAVQKLLSDAIALHKKNQAKETSKKDKPTATDVCVSGLNEIRHASRIGGKAGAAFALKATTAMVQTLPNITIAAAISAALLGNVSEETMETLAQHCFDNTLSLCENAQLYERLDAREKLMVTALLNTSNNADEKEAIHAIAKASVETGADAMMLLAFAQLESAMGKLTSAPTSTAKGLFQDLEGTWLEKFKKWAAAFDPAHKELADKIYRDAKTGKWEVRGDGIKEHILHLRHDDELQSFITAKDRIAKDARFLKDTANDDGEFDTLNIMDIACGLNMGVAAGHVKGLWDAFIHMMQRDDIDATQKDDFAAFQQDQMIDVVTDIYLAHFLGDRGKDRFMAVYDDVKNPLRFRPVKDLYDHSKMPVSKRAVTANRSLFLGGEASVFEARELIRNRVVAAFDGFDRRLERHLIMEGDKIENKIKFQDVIAAPRVIPTSKPALRS